MSEIIRHYGQGGLTDRILDAIRSAGVDLDQVTVDHLGPVDEFHIGGRPATEGLIARSGIPKESHVLDIGSGVGGTARHLAATGSHKVVGVDITPEYVEVAKTLTDLVGLGDRVSFQLGDVLDLPFPGQSFDAAVQLHVGMNIEDKQGAFVEVARVLKSGGRFAIYDIVQADNGDIPYPMPWAVSPSTSFLASADEYTAALETAGFTVEAVRDRTDAALSFFETLRNKTGPPSPIGLHLLMGAEASTRYGNMVQAVESGSISPVEIVARPRD